MPAPLPLAAALLFAAPPGPPDPPPSDAPTVAGRTAAAYAEELTDGNRVVRGRAALSLRAFGPAGVPHLADALSSDDEAVRFWAAEGLGMTPDAEIAPAAVDALSEMITDGRTAEGLAAAFALAARGDAEAALPVLLDGLNHPARGVAVTAADFLARLGETAAPAADALKTAARGHDDYHVRYRSAQALTAATGERLPNSEIMR